MDRQFSNNFNSNVTIIVNYIFFQNQLLSIEVMLISLHHLPGCTTITRSYKALMDAADIEFWAHNFQSFVAECENSLGDFENENLIQLLRKVFEGQCMNSWNPLFETFNHLWTCRYLLLQYKNTTF